MSESHSNYELFAEPAPSGPEELAPDAWILRGFIKAREAEFAELLRTVLRAAPLRQMETPGGRRMSVQLSNCGTLGWLSDRRGYRYSATDPRTGRAWPPMPAEFLELAGQAAVAAGFSPFVPDACLINRYVPGARMSLHQDRNESDFDWPIVSVSLGLSAIFLFGSSESRSAPTRRSVLHSGDVVVWGGSARLAFHGVAPIRPGEHPVFGACRMNLTLRKAG